MLRPSLLMVIPLVVALGCSSAPASTPASAPSPRAQAGDAMKPYAEVVPDDARSDSGLFVIHRVDGKLLYEVPDSLLDRDMLMISQIAAAPSDLSPFLNAGSNVAEQVVHWGRQGDRILLRTVSYASVANDTLPIFQSVQNNNFPPIIRAFRIEALNPDSTAVVIDVTPLFEQDITALGGLSSGQREQFRVRRLDDTRTFIESARSFPQNVEVRHTLTYDAAQPPSQGRTSTISMRMAQSMVLLPAEPMRGRYSDPRIGFFSVNQIDFSSDEQKAATRSFIRRWRLEPSDPAAYARGELVDPVKPIVFYLDPATPHEWRPYIRQGVEDWQGAFEAAGFSNAILAKDPPTAEEDPDFSPEDVRYSTVRYVANLTRNATGPSVSDPRTGEIIASDIIWYHNHIRSYRNRLMLETGAADPRARSLRLDMDHIGEAVRAVIAHEIGHAIGLPHNMIASNSFPVDSLRSPTFTERMGVAPTIMEYARQNYVAQPGDGVTRFIRKMGPYDDYVINWGYRVIPGAATADDERAALDRWIRERAGDPMYRYGRQRGGLPVDPQIQTEDLGDDPVRASGYGIANLQRVAPRLVEWTSNGIPGQDYGDLEELYGELIGNWNRYVSHVVANVGGVYETLKATDQEGPVYVPVPRQKQKDAVDFLVRHVFETPEWLVDPDILRRFEHAGAVDRVRQLQVSHMNRLLDAERMQRLIEDEVFRPGEAYALLEMMNDVRAGIWGELAGNGTIDTYRRNLQRAWLERMEYLLTEEPNISGGGSGWRTPVRVSQSDIRAVARGQLVALRGEAASRLGRTQDPMTRYHLEDVLVRVDEVLDTRPSR